MTVHVKMWRAAGVSVYTESQEKLSILLARAPLLQSHI